MTPVEIPRTARRNLRIRFVQNTAYGGVDYGPSYRAKEAQVREDWARFFVRKGRAEYVQAGTTPEAPTTPEVPEVRALPGTFPGYEPLAEAGLTTYEALRGVEDLTALSGIGPATARRILAALEEAGGR